VKGAVVMLLTAAQRSKDNGPVQTQATLGG
jgi:hypothetical protein